MIIWGTSAARAPLKPIGDAGVTAVTHPLYLYHSHGVSAAGQ